MTNEGWHIGVIGGSGLYEGIGLEDAQQIPVGSPFGEPSGPVTLGRLGGVRFAFLPRHGPDHRLPPAGINYRANIDVLKRCGVTDVVAISAIGSLRDELAPGHFVAVDQLIDHTRGRECSFFGEGVVAHVGMADPVCPRLSALAADGAEAAGARIHRGGCYIAIDGPQFSTRAESRMYREWGADVIGMTAMPEARLAREAELPYALLSMVTDYDCWREGGEAVEAAEVFRMMGENVDLARAALRQFATLLPQKREPSPTDSALDNAFATDKAARDPALLARLDAVCRRVLARDS